MYAEFNATLKSEEIEILSSLLGMKINYIEPEKGSLTYSPEEHIYCNGICRLHILSQKPREVLFLEIKASTSENPVSGDEGNFEILFHHVQEPTLVEKMELGKKGYEPIGLFDIYPAHYSVIKKVVVYGNHYQGKIGDKYSNVNIEYLEKFEYSLDSCISIKSTEIIVLCFEDESYWIFQNSGFATKIYLNYRGNIEKFIEQHFSGSNKNMTLLFETDDILHKPIFTS